MSELNASISGGRTSLSSLKYSVQRFWSEHLNVQLIIEIET